MLKKTVKIPGLDPVERLKNLSNGRIILVLSDKLNLKKRIYDLFDEYYSPVIREYFNDSEDDVMSSITLLENIFGIKSERQIFFSNDALSWDAIDTINNLVLDHLVLPVEEEASLMYDYYNHYAFALAITGDNSLSKIIELYTQELSTDDHKAILTFIIDINNNIRSDRIKLLSKIYSKNIRFEQLFQMREGVTPPLRKLLSVMNSDTILAEKLSNKENKIINSLSDQIKIELNGSELNEFKEIIKSFGNEVEIDSLLSEEVLQVINEINELNTNSTQRLFTLLSTPLKFIFENSSGVFGDYKKVAGIFFNIEDIKERENVLHFLAANLYNLTGNYALSPIKQFIFNAMSIRVELGYLCTFMIYLPFLIIAIFFGYLTSLQFGYRDKIRESIIRERDRTKIFSPIRNELVTLFGREHDRNQMISLSNKNSSTIAITGRRGAGKSRLLREIYSEKCKEKSIGVWIDCPSQYSQDDFITSLLERLAFSTEDAIAKHLNFDSLTIRELAREEFNRNFIIVSIFLSTAFAVSFSLFRNETILLFSPVLLVVLISMILMASYYFGIQPVDFSNRFTAGGQEDKSYHTSILYRRTREAIDFVNKKTKGDISSWKRSIVFFLRIFFLVIIGSTIIFLAADFLFFEPTGFMGSMMRELLPGKTQRGFTLALLVVLWGVLYSFKFEDRYQVERGNTLISLIEYFREFASEIVNRTNFGALDQRNEGIIVCIDELDKIIEDKEIKAFIRNIKAIFDISGVKYYLSMSEDAMLSFTLGNIAGKNEFDSAFDHILRIEPIPFRESMQIASNYLSRQSNKKFDEDLYKVIAFLSFGVPRDIIRKCDYALSMQINKNGQSFNLVTGEKLDKLNSAYLLGIINSNEKKRLSFVGIDGKAQGRSYIDSTISEENCPVEKIRFLSYIYILIRLEENRASILKSDSSIFIQDLFLFGYDLSYISEEDIRQRISSFESIDFSKDEIDQIKKFIQKNDLKSALNSAAELFARLGRPNEQIILLMRDLTETKKAYNLNLIDNQDYNSKLSKISFSILEVIDGLKIE